MTKFTKAAWVMDTDRTIYVKPHGIIAEIASWMGAEEADANAHLIVTAPEMYAQLERVRAAINCFWSGDIRDELMSEIVALLAKARGEAR